jgi:hypothetical protein
MQTVETVSVDSTNTHTIIVVLRWSNNWNGIWYSCYGFGVVTNLIRCECLLTQIRAETAIVTPVSM